MPVITFDSNVWRQVGNPGLFSGDEAYASLQELNRKCREGLIYGRLSETMFTLEAIKRKERMKVLGEYSPKISFDERIDESGQIHVTFCIESDISAHPGNNEYLDKHLLDALSLGFRVMKCPRIASFINTDVFEGYYVPDSETPEGMNELFDEVSRRIEENAAGIAWIKKIAFKYAVSGEPWQRGLAEAPDTEKGAIASAVAEWADADMIAAHIAYENSLLCSRDTARNSTINSVFSDRNRDWLHKEFGLRIVSPEELAKIV